MVDNTFFLIRLSIYKKHLSELIYKRLKNKNLKITQLEKARFIKLNELKLIQVEFFSFCQFMCVAANASELF